MITHHHQNHALQQLIEQRAQGNPPLTALIKQITSDPYTRLCLCFCHDMNGGPCHQGQKCVCNDGDGFDDTSDWQYTTTRDLDAHVATVINSNVQNGTL